MTYSQSVENYAMYVCYPCLYIPLFLYVSRCIFLDIRLLSFIFYLAILSYVHSYSCSIQLVYLSIRLVHPCISSYSSFIFYFQHQVLTSKFQSRMQPPNVSPKHYELISNKGLVKDTKVENANEKSIDIQCIM